MTTAITPASARAAVLEAVRVSDPLGVLCARLYPAPVRGHYLALRAFDAELRGVRTSVSNELLGRIKLAWWRDAVRAIFASTSSSSKPPAHPVALALAGAVHDVDVRNSLAGGLREGHLQALIDAREAELATQTPATLRELEVHAEKAESRLLYLTQSLLGVTSYALPRQDIGPAEVVLSHLGKAAGLVRTISQIQPSALGTAQAAAMGLLPGANLAGGGLPARVLIPLDLLAQHHLSETDIIRYFTPPSRAEGSSSSSLDDERSNRVQESVYAMATRANDYLLSARMAYRDAFTAPDPESMLDKRGWKRLRPALAESVGTTSYLSLLQRKAQFDLRHPSLHPKLQGGNFGMPARMLWMHWTGRI